MVIPTNLNKWTEVRHISCQVKSSWSDLSWTLGTEGVTFFFLAFQSGAKSEPRFSFKLELIINDLNENFGKMLLHKKMPSQIP